MLLECTTRRLRTLTTDTLPNENENDNEDDILCIYFPFLSVYTISYFTVITRAKVSRRFARGATGLVLARRLKTSNLVQTISYSLCFSCSFLLLVGISVPSQIADKWKREQFGIPILLGSPRITFKRSPMELYLARNKPLTPQYTIIRIPQISPQSIPRLS